MITYEQDHYAWLAEQARLLRAGQFADLDIPHLIEDLESMGTSEKKELVNRLEVLITHLLKWQYQPSRRGKSWEFTIQEQRDRISDHLADNPSLKNPDFLAEVVTKAYKYSVRRAIYETGLPEETFPKTCPYSWEKMIDPGFYP